MQEGNFGTICYLREKQRKLGNGGQLQRYRRLEGKGPEQQLLE